jgi:hypothetical protein
MGTTFEDQAPLLILLANVFALVPPRYLVIRFPPRRLGSRYGELHCGARLSSRPSLRSLPVLASGFRFWRIFAIRV